MYRRSRRIKERIRVYAVKTRTCISRKEIINKDARANVIVTVGGGLEKRFISEEGHKRFAVGTLCTDGKKCSSRDLTEKKRITEKRGSKALGI